MKFIILLILDNLFIVANFSHYLKRNIFSIDKSNNFAILNAVGKLGSNFSFSIAFIA